MQKPFAESRKLIAHMKRVMIESHGVGLAAPQIGISSKIIVVQGPKKVLGFINPKIIHKSKDKNIEEEGCLSIPGIFVPIKRHTAIQVECLTPEGTKVRMKAKGLASRIFQHEIDHIEGTLITDRLSWRKRWRIRKALKEIQE